LFFYGEEITAKRWVGQGKAHTTRNKNGRNEGLHAKTNKKTKKQANVL